MFLATGVMGKGRLLAASLCLTLALIGCAPTTTSTGPSDGRLGSRRAEASPACTSPDQTVTISDPSLAKEVMRALSRPDTDANTLPCAAIAELTSVTARGVASLEGLQYAANLSSISLEDSSISTLAPLSGLLRLQSITVLSGSLQTLDSLVDAPALSVLKVRDNALEGTLDLSRFTRLVQVELSGNRVADIRGLGASPDLWWLDLSDNEMTDVSVLGDAANLRVVKLNRNAIEDASALGGLTQLGWIEMENNLLSNVDFLQNLDLRILKLSGNRITSVAGLARNRYLGAEQPYDLRHNCIDLASSDPFMQDLLARGESLLLEPQAECAAG